MLDVSSLRGVLTYEPEELILTALPGTPVDEIEALLAERGQCLAFEPPNFSALLNPGGSGSRHAPRAAWSPLGCPVRVARRRARCATTFWESPPRRGG